jgi:hypothetical protein
VNKSRHDNYHKHNGFRRLNYLYRLKMHFEGHIRYALETWAPYALFVILLLALGRFTTWVTGVTGRVRMLQKRGVQGTQLLGALMPSYVAELMEELNIKERREIRRESQERELARNATMPSSGLTQPEATPPPPYQAVAEATGDLRPRDLTLDLPTHTHGPRDAICLACREATRHRRVRNTPPPGPTNTPTTDFSTPIEDNPRPIRARITRHVDPPSLGYRSSASRDTDEYGEGDVDPNFNIQDGMETLHLVPVPPVTIPRGRRVILAPLAQEERDDPIAAVHGRDPALQRRRNSAVDVMPSPPRHADPEPNGWPREDGNE